MFYLNCMAKDVENAKEIIKESNGKALIAALTKSYSSDEEAITAMNEMSKELDGKISIGLGGGDPKQCYMVTRVAAKVNAMHANQVFTEVPATRAIALNKEIIINSLVSPSGTKGTVIISTGPESSQSSKKAEVPAETAIIMIKEMGANSVKYFNMKNLKSDEEFEEVAKACAKHGLIMEMTGGLGLHNIEKYIKISKEQGIKDVIPHVYSSIVDKETGKTRIEDVKKLWEIFNRYY